MNPKQRRPCIIANWKMRGTKKTIEALLQATLPSLELFKGIDIVICPPTIYLSEVQAFLQRYLTVEKESVEDQSRIFLGAQNVYSEPEGAFTGEVSASMLQETGCQYVIIGHSERRTHFHEEEPLIARKWQAAYHAGLTPIFCLGETQLQREQGKTFEVLQKQLESLLTLVPFEHWGNGIMAYEPVWAIGTGLSASPLQVEEVHQYLRNWLTKQEPVLGQTIHLLYGGSVTAKNIESLMAIKDVDGALVGSASWSPNEFINICRSVSLIARV